MEPPEVLTTEFDAPWKVALERFLEPFLRLCFPGVHALIDWSQAPVFLDTELQQIAPEHQEGPRSVDKLVRVLLKSGQEEWLLIHVEVQAQPEREFARRMFVYFYRIWDRFGQRIVSLAVLADDDPGWRPQCFHTELAGCVEHFEFPTFKVLDCRDGEEFFERTGNVFGLLVAAHRAALTTRREAAARFGERFRLVKYLYRHGQKREEVVWLFRLISWLTRLPEEWELRFREELNRFEQVESPMTELLSPIELMAQEKGRQEGLEEGRQARRADILEILEVRFGKISDEVRAKVDQLRDDEALSRGHRTAITASSPRHFFELLQPL